VIVASALIYFDHPQSQITAKGERLLTDLREGCVVVWARLTIYSRDGRGAEGEQIETWLEDAMRSLERDALPSRSKLRISVGRSSRSGESFRCSSRNANAPVEPAGPIHPPVDSNGSEWHSKMALAPVSRVGARNCSAI
jgi:hypothetical protein